jgi:3-hydroxyacyl-[acyl-carrier-protein] dehydratase
VKFILTDHLVSIEPGKKIVVAKNVSMAEEYLADHFPGFPVLPGVMMLEAAIQTCAWLVRQHNHFAQSVIVLREARGIKYSTFVAPGQTLVITAETGSIEAASSDFRVKGTVNGSTAIAGRLELSHMNLHGHHKTLAATDETITASYRQHWALLQERAASA